LGGAESREKALMYASGQVHPRDSIPAHLMQAAKRSHKAGKVAKKTKARGRTIPAEINGFTDVD
jgi:hypothetical protein